MRQSALIWTDRVAEFNSQDESLTEMLGSLFSKIREKFLCLYEK